MEDESEKRPRAEHVGRSKFLTPVLKPSPVCAHHDRKHGANAEWSWVRCMSCHQIEQIPKMEISKMEEWNSVMIYRKPDYLETQMWEKFCYILAKHLRCSFFNIKTDNVCFSCKPHQKNLQC